MKNKKYEKRINSKVVELSKKAEEARARLNASLEERKAKFNRNEKVITEEKDKKQEEEREAKKELRKQRLAKNYQRMAINLKLCDLLPQKIEGLNQNKRAFKVDKYAYNSLLSVDELNKCLESNNPLHRLNSLREAFTAVMDGLTGEDDVSNNLRFHCRKMLDLIIAAARETGATEEIIPICVLNPKSQEEIIPTYTMTINKQKETSPKALEIQHELIARYKDNLEGYKPSNKTTKMIENFKKHGNKTIKQELIKIGGSCLIPFVNDDGRIPSSIL